MIGEKGSEKKTEKRAENELLSSMRFNLTTYSFLLLFFCFVIRKNHGFLGWIWLGLGGSDFATVCKRTVLIAMRIKDNSKNTTSGFHL